jgi:hypothetical protein
MGAIQSRGIARIGDGFAQRAGEAALRGVRERSAPDRSIMYGETLCDEDLIRRAPVRHVHASSVAVRRLSMARRIVPAFALLLGVSLAACERTTGPGDLAVGTYSLFTVDNIPVPVTIDQQAGYRRDLTGGIISLNADGTFSDRLATREVIDGAMVPRTDTIIGTYKHTGNVITFTAAVDGSQWNGTLTGFTITEILSGHSLAYQK